MKHIKLLFSISVLLLSYGTAKSQNIFLDSSTYYTYIDAPSLTQGLSFVTYSKESIHLDSTNTKGVYFTVSYSSKDRKQHQYVYFLRANYDSVFFSGILRNENDDSFEVKDLLIYDFSLKSGDTLKILHNASSLNIQLLVDSIKNVTYKDNKVRKIQFYSILIGATTEYYQYSLPLFASQGLGSNFGLLPFKLVRRNSPFWQRLISVCDSNKNVVYSDYENYASQDIQNYCDENEIIKLIDKIRSSSVGILKYQQVKVYPNPVKNVLKIDANYFSNFVICNTFGQIVMVGKFENEINVSKLPAGIYQLILENNERIYHGKFVKE